MLIAGRISGLVFLVAVCAAGLFLMARSKKWKPTFRRIAGLDALKEAVGRATEMGRPVHFTSGCPGSLNSPLAPQIIAGMSVLADIAEHCAKYGTRLIVSLGQPDVIPLATETVREAYVRAGKLDEYRPLDISYYSDQEFPYCVAVQGAIEREKPAANIMVGAFYGDQIAFAEVGYRVGAIQVGGTARIVQIPFFAVVCDYTLIGEEIFAVGAYLSQDPVQLASVASQDVFKLLAIVLISVGVLFVVAGNNVLFNLFRV